MAQINPIFTEQEIQSEEWRIIAAFPKYEVSSLGRVRRCVRGRRTQVGRLATIYYHHPYPRVQLWKDDKRYSANVHQLIAAAFIGHYPSPKHEINHKDANKRNNRANNLEYLTKAEHQAHTKRMGLNPTGDDHWSHRIPERLARGEKHPHAGFTESEVRAIRQELRDGFSLGQIAKKRGVSKSAINHIKHRRSWADLPD